MCIHEGGIRVMKGMFFAAMVCVIVLCGAAWGDVAINATNFPDAMSRRTILNDRNYNPDGDTILSTEEAARVTTMNVSEFGIVSLKGIEHFTYLTENQPESP